MTHATPSGTVFFIIVNCIFHGRTSQLIFILLPSPTSSLRSLLQFHHHQASPCDDSPSPASQAVTIDDDLNLQTPLQQKQTHNTVSDFQAFDFLKGPFIHVTRKIEAQRPVFFCSNIRAQTELLDW